MTSATLFGASTVPPPRPGDLPAVFLTANTLSFFKLSHVSSTSEATALVAPTTYTNYVLVAAQPRASDSSLTLDTADICSAEASAAVQSVISASTVAAQRSCRNLYEELARIADVADQGSMSDPAADHVFAKLPALSQRADELGV